MTSDLATAIPLALDAPPSTGELSSLQAAVLHQQERQARIRSLMTMLDSGLAASEHLVATYQRRIVELIAAARLQREGGR